ncbi:cytochrome C [Cystobacter ferrugineus]|uniref:Cytochrome C n=1 Tax=Cystobacter ferrugineus TaxID=83449 RepID=A0A1L9B1M6_9BACT|nr:cytochrome C [Cystobacter ferrugineus]OJH36150.1 cytochrome C [Cystobacter ferrugineus]
MSSQVALGVPAQASVLLRSVGLAALLWGAGFARPAVASEVTAAQKPGEDARELGRPGKPVPLALEVGYEGLPPGKAQPLRVKAGQSYYINQIDLREVVKSTRDEGVDGLRRTGRFAQLPWHGLKQADEEPILLANADGTFTRRRFYRQAQWMEQLSIITVLPVDGWGRPTGRPILLNIGRGDRRLPTDAFFIRRLRAVQTTADCKSVSDCSTARNFTEEALVEVRNARTGAMSFTLTRNTRALRLFWTMRPGADFYTIPIEQEDKPAYAYGASVDIKALTPPRPNGTYAAGSNITFQLTLRDGAGKRLHPQGSLPTYKEYTSGRVESGIQYYRAFFEPTTTYYLRKHRERMLMTQIIGPAHKIQPIRSIVDLDAFFGADDVQTVGTIERDGVFAQFQTFPPANDLFGGAFFPEKGGWDAAVSDTWTYTLPANAEPGTYLVTVKGRRVYLGEDIPFSKTINIQVESARPTQPDLTTGPCNSCHSDGGELVKVLHANDNRAGCNACHAPLGFELEGPIAVRTHFIHSRSGRYDSPLQQCDKCHLTAESLERTSKAACLSCHKSYPDSHVQQFGPIESMYVGGGRESFQQCTDSCHKTHPGSNL